MLIALHFKVPVWEKFISNVTAKCESFVVSLEMINLVKREIIA